MANIKEILAKMDTRQKVTLGIFTVVVIVIIWKLIGLMRESEATAEADAQTAQAAQTPGMPTPKPAPVQTAQTGQSPEEQEMQREQKENQAKYIAAMNELQLLKVAQQLVETNEKIMKSKEETVTSFDFMIFSYL